jgi:hypothetical protein
VQLASRARGNASAAIDIAVRRTSNIRGRNVLIGGSACRRTKSHAGDNRCDERSSTVSIGALTLCQALSKSAALFGGGPTIRDDDGGHGGAATFASFCREASAEGVRDAAG